MHTSLIYPMWMRGKIWRGIQKLSLKLFVLHEFIHAHCSRILECPLDRGVWRIHLVNETIFDWMSLQIRSLLFEWYTNISLGLRSVAKGHIKDPTIAQKNFLIEFTKPKTSFFWWCNLLWLQKERRLRVYGSGPKSQSELKQKWSFTRTFIFF